MKEIWQSLIMEEFLATANSFVEIDTRPQLYSNRWCRNDAMYSLTTIESLIKKTRTAIKISIMTLSKFVVLESIINTSSFIIYKKLLIVVEQIQ